MSKEFRTFAVDLQEAAGKLEKLAGDAVGDAVRAAGRTARESVAVDTGDLRKSLMEVHKGKFGQVLTRSRYATFQEYGTSMMPAHPFIRPASEVGERVLFKRIEDIVEDLL